MMTFDTVKRLSKWTPIRNCPGRFVLRGVLPAFSVVDSAIDAGGPPLDPTSISRIAEDIGLEVSKNARMADTIDRIRVAIKRY